MRLVADRIPDGSQVLDMGCASEGLGELLRFTRRNITYCPSDIVPRTTPWLAGLPASRKWSIGTSISTGWLPVEKTLPFFICMRPSSVHTTRMGFSPVYLLSYVCFAYLVWHTGSEHSALKHQASAVRVCERVLTLDTVPAKSVKGLGS